MTLASLALVDFMSFCSISIMAPFFPKEASQKGLSDTLSGFIFSFYALVMFTTSPIFGKLVRISFAQYTNAIKLFRFSYQGLAQNFYFCLEFS